MIDAIVLIDLRRLVYSFLLSKRNIKGAKKIHYAQSRKNKVTLGYIKEYTAYPKEFVLFQKCWILFIITLVPQYIVIALAQVLWNSTGCILVISFWLAKLILGITIRMQFNSKRISKYDKRY